jgi:hypothetical protein
MSTDLRTFLLTELYDSCLGGKSIGDFTQYGRTVWPLPPLLPQSCCEHCYRRVVPAVSPSTQDKGRQEGCIRHVPSPEEKAYRGLQDCNRIQELNKTARPRHVQRIGASGGEALDNSYERAANYFRFVWRNVIDKRPDGSDAKYWLIFCHASSKEKKRSRRTARRSLDFVVLLPPIDGFGELQNWCKKG